MCVCLRYNPHSSLCVCALLLLRYYPFHFPSLLFFFELVFSLPGSHSWWVQIGQKRQAIKRRDEHSHLFHFTWETHSLLEVNSLFSGVHISIKALLEKIIHFYRNMPEKTSNNTNVALHSYYSSPDSFPDQIPCRYLSQTKACVLYEPPSERNYMQHVYPL